MADNDNNKGTRKGTGKLARIKQLVRRQPIQPHSVCASTSSPSPQPRPSLASVSAPEAPHPPQTSSPPVPPTQQSSPPVPPTEQSSPPVPPTHPYIPASSAPQSGYDQASASVEQVGTQFSVNKPILRLHGDGFLPSHVAANAISNIFRGRFEDAWPSWTLIPIETRNMWFDEFMRQNIIEPSDGYWARKNFEKRGAVLMKNTLQKYRKRGQRPLWMDESVWDSLCQHWQSESFKIISEKAKANRASDCGGLGGSKHTCGSITSSQHRANLTEQHGGVPPGPSELFRHTHQRKDHSWVDERSARIAEQFEQAIQQLTQSSDEGAPPPNHMMVWQDIAGVKKGKIVGLGLESTAVRPQYRGSSSSSSDLVRRQELQQYTNLIEQQSQKIQELTAERAELKAEMDTQKKNISTQKKKMSTQQKKMSTQQKKIESMEIILQQLLQKMNVQPDHLLGSSMHSPAEANTDDDDDEEDGDDEN